MSEQDPFVIEQFLCRPRGRFLRQAKQLAKRGLLSPFAAPLRRRYMGLVSCLMYHQVVPEPLDPFGFYPNIGIAVEVGSFERQISFFAENYRCLSIDQAIELLHSGATEDRAVVISFDDGYLGNYLHALPVLERYQVPAVIYCATDYIAKRALPWWEELAAIIREARSLEISLHDLKQEWQLESIADKYRAFYHIATRLKEVLLKERRLAMRSLREQCPEAQCSESLMMNWEQLREISKHPLITIGTHTRSHPNLKLCNEGELEEELVSSREELQAELGLAIDHFAYPYGEERQAGEREFRAAEWLEFRSAVTGRCAHWQAAHSQYQWRLPRIIIDYFDNLNTVKWKLSGCHALLAQRGRRVSLT